MRPLTRIISLGGCLHAVPMSAQIGGRAPSVSDAGQAEIDAYLEQVVSDTWIPGVVATVTNGEGVIYAGAFGSQDVAQARPMMVGSIFRIASMTRPIASAAVTMPVEDGEVGLDDPAAEIGAVLPMQYRPFCDDTAIEALQGFEARVYRHLH